jgi:hypothetical protein
LEALARKKQTFRLRRIDLSGDDRSAGQQHGIRAIPTLWLYDGTEKVSEDSQEILGFLQK